MWRAGTFVYKLSAQLHQQDRQHVLSAPVKPYAPKVVALYRGQGSRLGRNKKLSEPSVCAKLVANSLPHNLDVHGLPIRSELANLSPIVRIQLGCSCHLIERLSKCRRRAIGPQRSVWVLMHLIELFWTCELDASDDKSWLVERPEYMHVLELTCPAVACRGEIGNH